MKIREEMVLKFSYPFEMIIEAEKLAELLKSKGFKFILFKGEEYWRHEFVVRKHKDYTWNETMKIINSVYAPRYKKFKTLFDDENREVIVCHA